VKRIDTRIRVVLEELLKRGPKFGSGNIIVGDKVEELGGDTGVYPLNGREAVFHTSSISVGRGVEDGWMWWQRPQCPR
jgi:hypothetical protein